MKNLNLLSTMRAWPYQDQLENRQEKNVTKG